MLQADKLAFLGFGNMGQAILQGLAGTGALPASKVWVYDVDRARRDAARALGANVAETPIGLAQGAAGLILAVKPQQMAEALKPLGAAVSPDTLVISIAAGISIASISRMLGGHDRIARVMPNTPALVRAGAAGIALSEACSEADAALTRGIFEAVGIAAMVPENAIDAVTALSGSGPAYFFYMVECLAHAGAAQGLPAEQAARLAAQTLYGAGKLLNESGEAASTLRERVTSKGGTTEAALRTMAARDFDGLIQAAVAAAAARSRELGG